MRAPNTRLAPRAVWPSPLFPRIARAAAFVYFHIRYAGEAVPSRGPVLLVANHQNSLIDPVLVAATARRPVRFLAKAPLFEDWKIAWLVRASGAIPVYRRVDDPLQLARNEDTFRAVHAALAHGSAVGIFPEGLSHNEPALAPLKTGAARIALGAHALTRRTFPIVPVGLVFRQKDIFRSEALALAGRPVAWDDLVPRGRGDDVETHRRRLGRLRLRPADLVASVRFSRGLLWAVGRAYLAMPLAAALAIAGFLLFWIPYRLTGGIVERLRRPDDQRSTYKLLVGIATYAIWVLGLATAGVASGGVVAGLAVLVGVPAVGMTGLVIRERWRGAWSDARRFLLLRSRPGLVEALRARQGELAARLDALYDDFAARGAA